MRDKWDGPLYICMYSLATACFKEAWSIGYMTMFTVKNLENDQKIKMLYLNSLCSTDKTGSDKHIYFKKWKPVSRAL